MDDEDDAARAPPGTGGKTGDGGSGGAEGLVARNVAMVRSREGGGKVSAGEHFCDDRRRKNRRVIARSRFFSKMIFPDAAGVETP